ncbi:MAG: radical SAM protein [Spirochaetaceae bacterium]|jgi:putative pyruvate formate lyase activating enzyme|nr:radical SAM protein [Spirochaetaceae bacterium]
MTENNRAVYSSFPVYSNCVICPRKCAVDRQRKIGLCGESSELRLAFAGIHKGEEPPITGKGGSGTIFVSGCNLRCVFCQNRQISQDGIGRPVSADEFSKITLELQKQGAENINIVTGTHQSLLLIDYIKEAKRQGLHLPVLWNSSAYESIETIKQLDTVIDMYLPDLKTLDSSIATQFFHAEDYPGVASTAILQMIHSSKPVIIRHLALPGYLPATYEVLKWYKQYCDGKAQLSLMTQYTPVHIAGNLTTNDTNGASPHTNWPDTYLSTSEYDVLIRWLEELGIDDGYCQELVTGSDWLPDFRKPNPFSSELSKPVWHYNTGSIFTTNDTNRHE